MSSWRTAWRSLTREAGLVGLRFHDLRHHAITELAESSTSEQTILSIAGHVSARMLSHYSHVRLEAKRTALSALCNTGETQVTSQSTSQPRVSSRDLDLKSLKTLVDVTGIEPVTPCLQRLVARRINKLHQVRWNATDCYKCIHRRWLSGLIHYSVAISRVRWWAQNWAQSPGVRKV
jgi:Phage integrase family